MNLRAGVVGALAPIKNLKNFYHIKICSTKITRLFYDSPLGTETLTIVFHKNTKPLK
jgi:hypothetical protein